MFAGMLMGTSEFDAIYRCTSEQEHFLRIFNPTKEMRILEVGSGGGRWGFWLSDKVREYVGIDISPAMVAIAEKERIRRKLSNVRFECTTYPEFNDDHKFDLVYFSGVLQCMDDSAVAQCVETANSMLDGIEKTIISRDSVSELQREEKVGAYPAIFRTAEEYIDFFEAAGYSLDYSEVSYVPKRFTSIASKLYNLPLVTYGQAYAARELLCRIDARLGNPEFLKKREQRERPGNRITSHKFFRYVRRPTN